MSKDDKKVLRSAARCVLNEAERFLEAHFWADKWDGPGDKRRYDRLLALARRLREIAK